MGGFAAERPADWRYGSIAARRSAAGARAAGASVLRRVEIVGLLLLLTMEQQMWAVSC